MHVNLVSTIEHYMLVMKHTRNNNNHNKDQNKLQKQIKIAISKILIDEVFIMLKLIQTML